MDIVLYKCSSSGAHGGMYMCIYKKEEAKKNEEVSKMGTGWSQQEGGQQAVEEGKSHNQQSQQENSRLTVGENHQQPQQENAQLAVGGKSSNQRPQQENARLAVGGKSRNQWPQQENAPLAVGGKSSNQRRQQENEPLAVGGKFSNRLPQQEHEQLAVGGRSSNRLPQQENEQLAVGGKSNHQSSKQENAQPAVEEGRFNHQRGRTKKLPHNYQMIIREADTPTPDLDQLKSGVFLNRNKKKYWIEEMPGCNCFMLFARALSITWGEDRRYWSWFSVKETSDVNVEVANLVMVCWLEVDGKFETCNLSPNTTYEVVFVVMLDDTAFGWEVPVTLKLACPDGTVQERKERLKEKPREEWMELHAGDFQTSMEKGGYIQFTLLDYNSQWKHGLVVKGVVIRPKKSG